MEQHTNAVAAYEHDYLAWYTRRFRNPGVHFDAASLVRAIRAQYPMHTEWAEAAGHCTREWPRSELYTHFLSYPARQEKWRYAGGFLLDHPRWGTLSVDLIHDADAPGARAIGGLEYLDRVMGCRIPVKELRGMMERASAPRVEGRSGGLALVGEDDPAVIGLQAEAELAGLVAVCHEAHGAADCAKGGSREALKKRTMVR